jgi:hypothetical protein
MRTQLLSYQVGELNRLDHQRDPPPTGPRSWGLQNTLPTGFESTQP